MQACIIDKSTPGSLRPVVLNVSASDSAAMAGMQADLRVQQAMGVHGVTALTAVTAQHSGGMLAFQSLGADLLASQLQASLALRPQVMKLGVLSDTAQLSVLLDFLHANPMPLIYDPVLRTSAGFVCHSPALLAAISRHLLPCCELLTPNADEAEQLAGLPADSPPQRRALARALCGAGAVLLKGGHGLEADWACDFFQPGDGGQGFWLGSPRKTHGARGTGCTLSAAIAGARALGFQLPDAVVVGKMLLNQGLNQAHGDDDVGWVAGPSHFPDQARDLPRLFPQWPTVWGQPAFPSCGPRPLGLYPIVDRAHWLEILLPLGIDTLQLRIKDLEGQALSREIQAACALAETAACRLFINDHWQLAIEHGAYGVHLGQEDLVQADLEVMRQAGLRLGISTHCHYEVARAHALRPSYIACGPVHPTQTKEMPWRPLGAEGLSYWCRLLEGYPIVAIGGMDAPRLRQARACGADGVAVLSGITAAADPAQAAASLLVAWRQAGSQPSTFL